MIPSVLSLKMSKCATQYLVGFVQNIDHQSMKKVHEENGKERKTALGLENEIKTIFSE